MKSNAFAEGVAFEAAGKLEFAAAAYKAVEKDDSAYAAAQINLGTIHYNAGDMFNAEYCYRAAVLADSKYALAWFDLANVLDEKGETENAIEAYRTALKLAPTYDDAHYNLALAYEKAREPRKALPHWQAYVKLDIAGAWSQHARMQIKRILQAEGLKLVVDNGPAKKTGTAKLFIVKEKINELPQHRPQRNRAKAARANDSSQQTLFGGGEAS